ncbi:MAG: nucleotidyltransferase domain-containing protein [Nanoarchaeota archaeon]|nr:nucleotidyltransferase domain-containing protein [Nanoarchaeota archaeon]MBU1135383.1 nucleotidyltransferase domain-containing protein [Nanoarchaeota archaeon]MBU2520200.1 nucleotidyltransferase domain-containing protein [Nanoarchaeota archaeon]
MAKKKLKSVKKKALSKPKARSKQPAKITKKKHVTKKVKTKLDLQISEVFGKKPEEKIKGNQKPEKIGKKERVKILKAFTKELVKKHGPIIRAIVLFGSTAREEFKKESDIDVFVIIDDTRHSISPTERAKLEDEMVAIAKKLSRNLSVQQPYMLTEFWNMVRIGHPIVFNFIREGVPVYDKDIFMPIKRLLQMGEIKPSREAVEKYIERGPKRIKRVESAKIYMVVEDCYYAMLESAQAVLMFLGKTPPRPSEAPSALRKTVVKMKLLTESDVKMLEDIIQVRKDIEHRNKTEMSGSELDEWIDKAKKFVNHMQKMIVKIEILKRENMIKKSHMVMSETIMTLLKAMNKLPKSEINVPIAFEKHLVKPGLVSETYLDVFKDLTKMNDIVKEGKVLELPKARIMMQREYVRKFIQDAGRIMRKKIKPEDNLLDTDS